MATMAGAFAAAALAASTASSSAPYRLRVEYMNAPLGVDVATPRFSWVAPCAIADARTHAQESHFPSVDDDNQACRGRAQSASRLTVVAAAGGAAVWDSGWVNSSRSQNVPFGGPALEPDKDFTWTVSVTVAGGGAPPATVSASSTFSTGLFAQSDWAGAQWIGGPPTWPLSLLSLSPPPPALPPPPPPVAGARELEHGGGRDANAGTTGTGHCWPTLAGSYRASMLWGGVDEINITKTGQSSDSAEYTAVSYRLGPSEPIHFVAHSSDVTGPLPGGVGTLGPFNSSSPDCSAIKFASGDAWCRESVCSKCPGWPDCAQPPRPPPPPSPTLSSTLLRATFSTDKPVQRAVAYVVGLGYYKLFVNGARASTHELGTFTNFGTRVLYDTWDVTALLQSPHRGGGDGDASSVHCIGAMVLPGWYAQSTVNAGTPSLRLRLSITYTDGSTESVVTGQGWKAAFGPVTSTDIYQGEVYDARLERPGWTSASFNESGWVAAVNVPPPSDNVQVTSHATQPPVTVGTSYTPIAVYASAPGEYVFDFGQNMAGFTTLRIPAGLAKTPGATISQLFAEAVHGPPPSKIFPHMGLNEGAVYVSAGNGRAVEYTVQSTFMGFRYVQLTGYPGVPNNQTLTAHFTHTANAPVGSVSFSDPMLTSVQRITQATAQSNYQFIPSDCPQRERRGWLGDAQLSCETNLYNFDMAASYTTFVQQIDDGLNRTTGYISDTVPFYGHGRTPPDPAWGAAFALIADWVADFYADGDIFARHWDGLRLHTESLIATAAVNNYSGLLTFSSYSDWCPPSTGCRCCWDGPGGINGPYPKTLNGKNRNSVLVSSFYYVTQLRVMSRRAGELGKESDAARYGALADSVAVAFQSTFYDPVRKTYIEPGRQCSQYLSPQTTIALADTLGVIPPADRAAVIDNLVADVAAHAWHLDVGIVGMKYLLPALARNSRGDVAAIISQQQTPPSYVYMVEQGATTLWETWTSTRYEPGDSNRTQGVPSWNHIMFGSNSEFYFKHLAGLQQAAGSAGWSALELRPSVWSPVRNASNCANLSSANATLDTPRGLAAAAWSCGGGGGARFAYTVTVPLGSTGLVAVSTLGSDPSSAATTVTESGRVVWSRGAFVRGVPGVLGATASSAASEVAFNVSGGGTYSFVVK